MSEAASITVRVPLAIRRQPGPSISSMAAERIDRGYLGRVLQLTLLASNLVEAILAGRQPNGLRPPKPWKRRSARGWLTNPHA